MNERGPADENSDRDRELSRLREDFIDSWDEELEMEMDDDRFGGSRGVEGGSTLPRRVYFRELFRLQGELAWISTEQN
jgi:polyphosphate kinase